MTAGLRGLLACILLAAGLAACTLEESYSASEVRVRIVDSRTGEPIPGAIVVFGWRAEGLEGVFVGYLHVFEAITDKNGIAVAASWGPKRNPFSGGPRVSEPTISVLRAGFHFHGVNNFSLYGWQKLEVSRTQLDSLWNGKDIPIRPADSGIRNYRLSIGTINMSLLQRLLKYDPYAVPCLTLATIEFGKYFESKGLPNDMRWLDSKADLDDAIASCSIADELTGSIHNE